MQLECLCTPEILTSFKRPAIVVGHPGHELKVFGWIAEHRPQVHVITDGSGRQGISRLPSTAKLLSTLDAKQGAIFGSVSDGGVYRALLETDIPFFLDLLNCLVDSFLRDRVDFVAGDASEGFNPTHDICRAVVNTAVEIAEYISNRHIPNYEFCLTEWEQNCDDIHDLQCLHFRLGDDLLHRKLAAAGGYTELKEEVQKAIAARGEEYFRIECLRKVYAVPPAGRLACKPFYETFGEQRVAQGEYSSVIRYQQHMLPILRALNSCADRAHTISQPALAGGRHI
jgi:hypothetical protein